MMQTTDAKQQVFSLRKAGQTPPACWSISFQFGTIAAMSSSPESTEQSAEEAASLRILIVDNDEPHASAVAESLERVGYECVVATSGPAGAEKVEQEAFDLVITDLMMPDVDGLDILRRAKESLPEVEVILVTGHGTVPSAVDAMQQGAFNYLLKPLDIGHLRTVVAKAAEALQLRRDNVELHRRLDEKFGFEGVIGSSPQMNQVIGLTLTRNFQRAIMRLT